LPFLNSLVKQKAQREEKIAKLMANQMNSKLGEIEDGYNRVINQLKGSMDKLSD